MKEKESFEENSEEIISDLKKKKLNILKWGVVGERKFPWQSPFMTYLIMSIDDLKESTEKSSEVANKLSRKIFWLNIVLAAATAIAAFATVWMVFFE